MKKERSNISYKIYSAKNIEYFQKKINMLGTQKSYDATKSFNIRVIAEDELSTKNYDVIIASGTPAIAIYKDNVAIGQKYDTSKGGKLQVNGDVKADTFDGNASTTMLQSIGKQIYPVGSIYISINNTNPATLFGGTWTQIKDRFLYCTTTSNTTGGGTTTGGATGNTGATTLTTEQIPSHSHNGTTGTGYTSFMRAVGRVGTQINANHIPSYGSDGAYVDCTGSAYPRR